MKSNVNNLQKETRLLANNPVFLAHFLDEPVFDIPVQAQGATAVSTVQSPVELEVADSPVIELEASSNQEVPTESVAINEGQEDTANPDVSEHAETATLSVDWAGKVLVLTPEIPSESENRLLQKILSAVSLSENDFVHVHRSLPAKELIEFESAKIILSFGAVQDFAADHQVRTKRITVIICSPLHALEQDVEAKKKLWISLKGFFE